MRTDAILAGLIVLLSTSGAVMGGHGMTAPLKFKQRANLRELTTPYANIQTQVTSLEPGDIIVGDFHGALLVVDGASLELKGSLEQHLAANCSYIPGSFSIAPDNSFLVAACLKPSSLQQQSLSSSYLHVVKMRTDTFKTQVLAELPPDTEDIGGATAISPSGSLLVSGASWSQDGLLWDAVFEFKDGMLASVVNTSTQTRAGFGIISMDVNADSSTVLTADLSPQVDVFNMGASKPSTAYFNATGSVCSSVVALKGGSALVGCAGTSDGLCAYKIRSTGQVQHKWCTPSAARLSNFFGAVNLALMPDRKSFVMAVDDYSATGPYPNIFKIRLSDFTQMSQGNIPAWLKGGVAVLGALPAVHLQRACGVGQCCTPKGQVAAKGTRCNTLDPCSSGTCNGVSGECPAAQSAADGTLCALQPHGLFSPVRGGRFFTAWSARLMGYHKCGMCAAGTCVLPEAADPKRPTGAVGSITQHSVGLIAGGVGDDSWSPKVSNKVPTTAGSHRAASRARKAARWHKMHAMHEPVDAHKQHRNLLSGFGSMFSEIRSRPAQDGWAYCH